VKFPAMSKATKKGLENREKIRVLWEEEGLRDVKEIASRVKLSLTPVRDHLDKLGLKKKTWRKF